MESPRDQSPVTSEPPEAGLIPADEGGFYFVSLGRLVLLSLATLSFYLLYWAYKQWRGADQRRGKDGMAVVKTVFLVFTCIPLFRELKRSLAERGVEVGFAPILTGTVFIGFQALPHLPDPWWLLGLGSFLPILEVQRGVNALGRLPGRETPRPRPLGWLQKGLVAVGLSVFALGFASAFMLPETVVFESQIRPSWRADLVEAGYVEEDEQVLAAYFNGFFEVLEDGNLLTDRRVVSYARMPEEEPYFSALDYDRIASIDSDLQEGLGSISLVTVHGVEGETVDLILPPVGDGARRFHQRLRRRWGSATRDAVEDQALEDQALEELVTGGSEEAPRATRPEEASAVAPE